MQDLLTKKSKQITFLKSKMKLKTIFFCMYVDMVRIITLNLLQLVLDVNKDQFLFHHTDLL